MWAKRSAEERSAMARRVHQNMSEETKAKRSTKLKATWNDERRTKASQTFREVRAREAEAKRQAKKKAGEAEVVRTVTQIPATRALYTGTFLSETKTRKVAGYARVSTDHDDQITSYHAQVDYYTNYITNHTGWQLVKVYTDEGITGTSTKHRVGFQAMVSDALAGKIDLIITKSVSRFARNTVDSLTTSVH